MAGMSTDELARLLQGNAQIQPPAFRLGTIPAGYAGGRPSILFDGETSATARAYPMNADLTLSPGDRVLVAMVGRGGVVLCRVQ